MERKRLKSKSTPRHSERVEDVLYAITDLDKAEQKAVIFELVLYLALQGRTYEKTYAKLLLSALEYCDPRLRRFRNEMRSDGHVVMHRTGDDGRWMREAVSEAHGRVKHLKEEDGGPIPWKKLSTPEKWARLRQKNGPDEELSV